MSSIRHSHCCYFSPDAYAGGRFYKRATAFACACNLLALSCIVYTLLRSTSTFISASSYRPYAPSPSWNRLHDPRPRSDTEAESRLREAYEARRAMEPVELIKRVKEIQEESNTVVRMQQKNNAARLKYAAELAQKLKQLRKASPTINQQALEEWQRKKTHVKRKAAVSRGRDK